MSAKLFLGSTQLASESSGTITVDNATLSSDVTGTLGSGITFPAGHIIQTISYNFDVPYQGSPSGWVAVVASGKTFAVSITPTNSSNKILVTSVIQASSSDWYGININRQVSGESDVVINDAPSYSAGSKLHSTFGSMFAPKTEATDMRAVIYLDSPATTSAVTYAVFVVARYGVTTNSVSINRPHQWNDDAISGRATASNIILQEIQQ
jgi:hypothetical protein